MNDALDGGDPGVRPGFDQTGAEGVHSLDDQIDASVPASVTEGEAFLLIALSRLSMRSPEPGIDASTSAVPPDPLGYEGP